MFYMVLPIAIVVAAVSMSRKKTLLKEMKSRGAEELEEVSMEVAEF